MNALKERRKPSPFQHYVEPVASGCWLWSGKHTKNGYPMYGRHMAHRLSYQAAVGPIPEGLELDHLCCVPSCVNPVHLEPVTRAENIRRRTEAQTSCRNGHPYTGWNLAHTTDGRRRCRTCSRDKSRRHRLEQKAHKGGQS